MDRSTEMEQNIEEVSTGKTYLVSMAVSIPHNWEVEVEAEDERDAFRKAREMFDSDTSAGSYIMADDVEVALDLSDPVDPNDPWNPEGTSGVMIEEITKTP